MLLPVLLTLCGGLGWALGNLANRLAPADEPFRLTLRMSVVPPLPLLGASLAVEGPARMIASLTTLDGRKGALALAGLVFTVLVATIAGAGVWTALMSRHPSSTVAPFSMLAPVVGIGVSHRVLGEPVFAAELLCAAVVVAGVLLGTTGPASPRHARQRAHRPARPIGPPSGAARGRRSSGASCRCHVPSPEPTSAAL
jgi:O-acetylserine/cysteine efflux transporter